MKASDSCKIQVLTNCRFQWINNRFKPLYIMQKLFLKVKFMPFVIMLLIPAAGKPGPGNKFDKNGNKFVLSIRKGGSRGRVR